MVPCRSAVWTSDCARAGAIHASKHGLGAIRHLGSLHVVLSANAVCVVGKLGCFDKRDLKSAAQHPTGDGGRACTVLTSDSALWWLGLDAYRFGGHTSGVVTGAGGERSQLGAVGSAYVDGHRRQRNR